MKENFCYLNGEFVPTKEANVNVKDIGILRGFGVYDGLTTYNGIVFRLSDHFARLKKSADALGLALPHDEEGIKNILSRLIELNGYARTNFRVILTGGNTISGIEFDSKNPTFYVLAEEHRPLDEKCYRNGCSVFTYDHKRQYPEYKTINYITGVILQPRRKSEGAIEILYTFDGKVLEAATSNFFLVKNGTLITPRKSVLLGITRNVVIELMSKSHKVEERDIEISEIVDADEAFITATYKEVVPIVRIDNHSIGNGQVGKVTIETMRRFEDYNKAWR